MGLRLAKEVRARFSRGFKQSESAPLTASVGARGARELAEQLAEGGGEPVAAGRVRALLVLAEMLQSRLERYLSERPELLGQWSIDLRSRLGSALVERAWAEYRTRFLDVADARTEVVDSAPDERVFLGDLILMWSLAENPGTSGLARRLTGREAREVPEFEQVLLELGKMLEQAPPLRAEDSNLRESLLAFALASPDSLEDQVRFALDAWQDLDPDERRAMIGALDMIAEESAPRFPPGPGPVVLPTYDDLDDDTPNYSLDADWMDSVVLIAKNTPVWLSQLSTAHGKELSTLAEVPEAELERLAKAGITCVWLIGVWERSQASARIKRLLGNPGALASAYSLDSYEVAAELGGREALAVLSEKARRHGLRLAADMVPNHMGIDSRWVIEHPDWFLSVRECPFPTYTFDGPDLSSDTRVGIFLEDHYYDRSDAAVVFKRLDRATGEIRFIYHGNDGTSTPWNDTAQLDYLNPEAREAVTRTILSVAELVPVIRFDAAMTLAHRHIQRLWYPEPGSGGAIPSRSEHALTSEELRARLPTEFWRTVVDRVSAERPETLLLAEAFWLMESYFVRTLGMHRVYNSAFMNLLRDGETDRLRKLIRETVEFDPRILERQVNFLSNPDEETAVEQFGRGDRYFGACVTLATLPGLPLLGHGQLEGLSEKYGMEFGRPATDESEDAHVVARHRRVITPLLRRRPQFVGVEHFRLLDFADRRGAINGNILAYSNGRDAEASVVVFNNSPESVRGRLQGVENAFDWSQGAVYRLRDRTQGMNYLVRPIDLEGGLKMELTPFESRVLVDSRPIQETIDGPYRAVAERLAGRGVRDPDLEVEIQEFIPVLGALATLFRKPAGGGRRRIERELKVSLREVSDRDPAPRSFKAEVARIRRLDQARTTVAALPWPRTQRAQDMRRRLESRVAAGSEGLRALKALMGLQMVRARLDRERSEAFWQRLFEELQLPGEGSALGDVVLSPRVVALALQDEWLATSEVPGATELREQLEGWATRSDADRLLGLNSHDGESWLRQEELESIIEFRALVGISRPLTERERGQGFAVEILGWMEVADLLRRLSKSRSFALRPIYRVLGRASGSRGADGTGTASGRISKNAPPAD